MEKDTLNEMENETEVTNPTEGNGGEGDGSDVTDPTPTEPGGDEGEDPNPDTPPEDPDPEVPSIPATPIKTPQQMIDELHEEIDELQKQIDEKVERIRQIDIMRSRLLIPAIILESNHYYQSIDKLFVFKTMEQKELLKRFKSGLAPETVGNRTLEELLVYLNVPHEFYGREHTLYICLEPRFNFNCNCDCNNKSQS